MLFGAFHRTELAVGGRSVSVGSVSVGMLSGSEGLFRQT